MSFNGLCLSSRKIRNVPYLTEQKKTSTCERWFSTPVCHCAYKLRFQITDLQIIMFSVFFFSLVSVFDLVYWLFACWFLSLYAYGCVYVCMLVCLRTKNRKIVLKQHEVILEVGIYTREVCSNASARFITSVNLSACDNSRTAEWISMQVFVLLRCDTATPDDVPPYLKSRKTSIASLRKPESLLA
jgi:hypothetical protein